METRNNIICKLSNTWDKQIFRVADLAFVYPAVEQCAHLCNKDTQLNECVCVLLQVSLNRSQQFANICEIFEEIYGFCTFVVYESVSVSGAAAFSILQYIENRTVYQLKLCRLYLADSKDHFEKWQLSGTRTFRETLGACQCKNGTCQDQAGVTKIGSCRNTVGNQCKLQNTAPDLFTLPSTVFY